MDVILAQVSVRYILFSFRKCGINPPFPLPLVSSQLFSSEEFSHPAFDLIYSISYCPLFCSSSWARQSNISHISARPSQDVTCASLHKDFKQGLCMFVLNISSSVSDLQLKREPDSAYESAWNIIQCQNAHRGKNDKLKRHETLEEERREWWRRLGSGAGCSVPRQAPYGSVSEQRGTEVVMQKQWLSLYVGLALQSFKMSSPYEADHCSLSCFPFLPFTGCPAHCQPDMSLSPGTPTTIQHKYKEKSLTLPPCDRTCVLLPMFVCLFALAAICSTMRRRDTLCLLFPSLGVFSTNNNKHNLCARLIRTLFWFWRGEFGAVFLQSVF